MKMAKIMTKADFLQCLKEANEGIEDLIDEIESGNMHPNKAIEEISIEVDAILKFQNGKIIIRG